MPRPHPPEFHQRAVELVRLREKPISQIANELGISDSCLRNWVKQADIDDGMRGGVSTDEHAELIQLRRDLRTAKMEIEILKRAAAYFAKESSPVPK
jgi:transposase